MATTPTPALAAVLDIERRIEEARQRGAFAEAADLQRHAAKLWAQRREELAALAKRTPSRWDGMTFSVRRGA